MKQIPVRRITDTQNKTGGRFHIRRVADLLNGADLVHDQHRHDFYFILAIEKGKGTHEIDFVPYDITDHSIFLLRPGQVHRLELDRNSTGLLMEFDQEFYRPADDISAGRLKRAYHKNHCATEAAMFNSMMDTLTSIYHEMTEKAEAYTAATKAYLDIFFIEYIRASRNPRSFQTTANTYTEDKFEALTSLLEEHIFTLKNASEYAAMLHVSPFQLNAITRKAVGKTVSELIVDQIILEAKRRLLATSAQVKDIAYQLGYEDISYFIRYFKKHTGQTPEAYRRHFK